MFTFFSQWDTQTTGDHNKDFNSGEPNIKKIGENLENIVTFIYTMVIIS